MSTTVQQIIERIDRLAEEDRAELERYLAERAEGEWQREAIAARRDAAAAGIDQQTIDDAVSRHRYGK